MVEKWAGKIAVVTGSSSGIGAAIFKDFVKNGITVIGLARRSERVEEIIKELGASKAFAYRCDVSDPKSVTAAFKWIENKFEFVNILVNNAGIGRMVSILDENEESFTKANEIFDTNVRGLLQCTREAYRLMKKSDDYGLIVNINSILGHYVPNTGFPLSVYPASKYAVTALTELIRQELAAVENKKVRISSVSPGFVATEILAASGLKDKELAGIRAAMPSLNSEDISHAVMFLLSTPYTVSVSELTIKPNGEKN